jgi:hypothetical protein
MIGNNSVTASAQMFEKKRESSEKSTGSHFVLVAVMTNRASFTRSAGLMNQFDH